MQTLSRLIAVFEPAEQEMIRVRLSEQLQAVISQRLLPTKDGKGRVAACEIMPVTGTIRDCIRDPKRIEDIYDLIEEGGQTYGSQSFDQHLMALVRSGEVDFRVVMAAANNPTDFDLQDEHVCAGRRDSRRRRAPTGVYRRDVEALRVKLSWGARAW